MAIGQKIQKLRKKNYMSQEKLAEQLGVSRQAISKWEVGESIPDTDKVIQLSLAFDVPTDYLLFDDMIDCKDDAVIANETTNKRMDIAIPVIAATGVSLIGLLISIAAYFTWQTVFTVSVGLIVQITAIIFFEAMRTKNNESKSKIYRRHFYSINLWLILPFPVFYSFQFALEFYPYPRLLLIDLLFTAITYLFLCGIITFVMRKART
ncbi:helix-turn-helix domain-containing protein [Paenibacillus abyssi]|uniref:HTH cro/C1-type domain-containing protein n=1 Tax=Paenibacillus abyssi TaxID=1340531 RepID=A0A917CNE0_9BACL|nr:helix-turn-helix transcriptional regulator [Paenibacillus abyssi]GGF93816.1 hypothetical protein GCM10010916_08940 [Paenibacillus abyssi]